MNLYTEDGEGLTVPGGTPVMLDDFPVNAATRLSESAALVAYHWARRPAEGWTLTRGAFVLKVESAPVLVTGGLSVTVSLTEDGTPVAIDPHRVILNPPLVPRSGISEVGDPPVRILVASPGAAFMDALMDSVLEVPL